MTTNQPTEYAAMPAMMPEAEYPAEPMPAAVKTKPPFLAAAVWGMAAAGIALGVQYRQAGQLLPEIGELLSRAGVPERFAEAAGGMLLMLLMLVCGFCAVGQPGIFVLLLIQGIDVGSRSAELFQAGSSLQALVPAAVTTTLLAAAGCLSLRMSGGICRRLVGKESALSLGGYLGRFCGLIGMMAAFFAWINWR